MVIIILSSLLASLWVAPDNSNIITIIIPLIITIIISLIMVIIILLSVFASLWVTAHNRLTRWPVCRNVAREKNFSGIH